MKTQVRTVGSQVTPGSELNKTLQYMLTLRLSGVVSISSAGPLIRLWYFGDRTKLPVTSVSYSSRLADCSFFPPLRHGS